MVKHSRDFGPGEEPELDAYLPGLRPPLEAQLIDLADEVAYNTADLDDAFFAEMLTPDEVAASVPQYAAILDTIDTQFPGATARERFHETLRRLVDALVSGVIDGTVQQASLAGVETTDDVRAFPRRLVAFTSEAAETSRQLKRFLLAKVYEAPALTEGRSHSVAMVGELFQFFLNHPDRLPAAYREQAAQEAPHRVVCDYIAGMTDSFFRRIYEQNAGAVRLVS
jgi:dGTPase